MGVGWHVSPAGPQPAAAEVHRLTAADVHPRMRWVLTMGLTPSTTGSYTRSWARYLAWVVTSASCVGLSFLAVLPLAFYGIHLFDSGVSSSTFNTFICAANFERACRGLPSISEDAIISRLRKAFKRKRNGRTFVIPLPSA